MAQVPSNTSMFSNRQKSLRTMTCSGRRAILPSAFIENVASPFLVGVTYWGLGFSNSTDLSLLISLRELLKARLLCQNLFLSFLIALFEKFINRVGTGKPPSDAIARISFFKTENCLLDLNVTNILVPSALTHSPLGSPYSENQDSVLSNRHVILPVSSLNP